MDEEPPCGWSEWNWDVVFQRRVSKGWFRRLEVLLSGHASLYKDAIAVLLQQPDRSAGNQ